MKCLRQPEGSQPGPVGSALSLPFSRLLGCRHSSWYHFKLGAYIHLMMYSALIYWRNYCVLNEYKLIIKQTQTATYHVCKGQDLITILEPY